MLNNNPRMSIISNATEHDSDEDDLDENLFTKISLHQHTSTKGNRRNSSVAVSAADEGDDDDKLDKLNNDIETLVFPDHQSGNPKSPKSQVKDQEVPYKASSARTPDDTLEPITGFSEDPSKPSSRRISDRESISYSKAPYPLSKDSSVRSATAGSLSRYDEKSLPPSQNISPRSSKSQSINKETPTSVSKASPELMESVSVNESRSQSLNNNVKISLTESSIKSRITDVGSKKSNQELVEMIGILQDQVGILTEQLNNQFDANRIMEGDLKITKRRLAEEMASRVNLQIAKDTIQSELEDLTKNLFEEANGIVAKEKKDKATLKEKEIELETRISKVSLENNDAQRRLALLEEFIMVQSDTRVKVSWRNQLQISKTSGISKEMASLFAFNDCIFPWQEFLTSESDDELYSKTGPVPKDVPKGSYRDCLLQECSELYKSLKSLGTNHRSNRLFTCNELLKCVMDEVLDPALKFPGLLVLKLSSKRLFDCLLNDTIKFGSRFESNPDLCLLTGSAAAESEQERLDASMNANGGTVRSSVSSFMSSFGGIDVANVPVAKGYCSFCRQKFETNESKFYKISLASDGDVGIIDKACKERIEAVHVFIKYIQSIKLHAEKASEMPSKMFIERVFLTIMNHARQVFYARWSMTGFFIWNDLYFGGKRFDEVEKATKSLTGSPMEHGVSQNASPNSIMPGIAMKERGGDPWKRSSQESTSSSFRRNKTANRHHHYSSINEGGNRRSDDVSEHSLGTETIHRDDSYVSPDEHGNKHRSYRSSGTNYSAGYDQDDLT